MSYTDPLMDEHNVDLAERLGCYDDSGNWRGAPAYGPNLPYRAETEGDAMVTGENPVRRTFRCETASPSVSAWLIPALILAAFFGFALYAPLMYAAGASPL